MHWIRKEVTDKKCGYIKTYYIFASDWILFTSSLDCIQEYGLKKIVEDWGRRESDGYIYFFFRPPWIKLKGMETYYKLHPEKKKKGSHWRTSISSPCAPAIQRFRVMLGGNWSSNGLWVFVDVWNVNSGLCTLYVWFWSWMDRWACTISATPFACICIAKSEIFPLLQITIKIRYTETPRLSTLSTRHSSIDMCNGFLDGFLILCCQVPQLLRPL